MPTISTCPRCQRQVSIPAGVASQAAVRCPLCDAEYPLSEALVLAPPELIPVISAAAQESASAPDRDVEAVSVADREGAEPVATIPIGGAEESADVAEEQAETAQEEVEEEEVNEAAAVALRTPGAAAASLRRREKSPLGALIGIVLGGLAGCALAYYGVLPLILWLWTPASKTEKVRGKPTVERVVKPDSANRKPLPVLPEPAKEASPEASKPPLPNEKEKAAPSEKPNDLPPPENVPKETVAPKAEPESPRSQPNSAQ